MFWDLGGQEELQSLWDKVGDVFGFLEMSVSLRIASVSSSSVIIQYRLLGNPSV